MWLFVIHFCFIFFFVKFLFVCLLACCLVRKHLCVSLFCKCIWMYLFNSDKWVHSQTYIRMHSHTQHHFWRTHWSRAFGFLLTIYKANWPKMSILYLCLCRFIYCTFIMLFKQTQFHTQKQQQKKVILRCHIFPLYRRTAMAANEIAILSHKMCCIHSQIVWFQEYY